MRAFMLILLLLLVHSLPPTLPVRAAQPPNQLFLPLLATPVPVTVISTHTRNSRTGGFIAQGELRNTSAQPVYDVALKLTAYNRQGTAVYSMTNVALLRAIFPDEVGAFSFDFPGDPFLYIRVTVIGWKTSIAEQFVPLEVVNYTTTVGGSYNNFTVVVTLRNNSALEIQRIEAVAWSFPQASLSRPQTFEEVLPPGGVTTITLYVHQSDDVAGVRVQAQGVP